MAPLPAHLWAAPEKPAALTPEPLAGRLAGRHCCFAATARFAPPPMSTSLVAPASADSPGGRRWAAAAPLPAGTAVADGPASGGAGALPAGALRAAPLAAGSAAAATAAACPNAGDNAGDCAALMGAYAAWGNAPAAWAAPIAAGTSMCAWSGVTCAGGRVTRLCVPCFLFPRPSPALHSAGGDSLAGERQRACVSENRR